ncbi:MAG: hypothetical protein IT359_05565 [Gemmatimonadaceae bacterium]|nr:hypothetical protein [Gemmatimonadaceae bacterium]
MAVFLAAVALQRASTQPWGRAAAPDGTTYELSAVGLSRLGRSATDTRTDCRWWPRYGDPALCAPAPGSSAAFAGIRRAYPMLQVALWLSVLALFLQALRVPRNRFAQAIVPAASGALAWSAIQALSRGASHGLAALADAPLHLSLQGYLGAVAAIVLSALSTVLMVASFDDRPPAPIPR